jgi:RsiW-degrading membrane proteinase PrsW (M82 family)
LGFAVLFLAFWGLQKRKPYGKWLAAVLLLLGMIAAIAESNSFQLISHAISQWQPLPAPPY